MKYLYTLKQSLEIYGSTFVGRKNIFWYQFLTKSFLWKSTIPVITKESLRESTRESLKESLDNHDITLLSSVGVCLRRRSDCPSASPWVGFDILIRIFLFVFCERSLREINKQKYDLSNDRNNLKAIFF